MFSFVFDKEELIWKNKERDHLRSMFQFYLGKSANVVRIVLGNIQS